MPQIEICLSPELIHLYELTGKSAVVVDILRATSCMTTALAHGIKHLRPVATLEECRALMEAGYVGAAERNGQKADGFDLGNSPFSYMEPYLQGRSIAMTTTNGTLAITKAKPAAEIVIASFLNLSAVVAHLQASTRDVVIICAGWKGRVNLEDTLFAGALALELAGSHDHEDDAVLAASALYEEARNDLFGFLQRSSHVNRLKRLNIQRDIEFCLTLDQFQVVPVMKEQDLVLFNHNMV